VDVSESDVLAVRRDIEKSGRPANAIPGHIASGEWRPCEIALADETEFKVKGRVDYVDPEMNASTGTLRVRTMYENADGSLLPGLFARVRFPMTSTKSFLVPDAALLSDQQGRYALVVNAQNEVEARRVKIGIAEKDMRVIEDGLAADDRVVVLGVLKARPGAKVTPVTAEESKKKAEDSAKAAAAAKAANAAKAEPKDDAKDKKDEGK
jgi:RND family efflux transporter MFP subunit